MRIAFILAAALVTSVFLHTEPASARPRGDQIAEAKKSRKKLKRKPLAKATRKVSKKMVKEEEAPVVREEAPVAVAAPTRRAQAVDDEVPRNEPKKR